METLTNPTPSFPTQPFVRWMHRIEKAQSFSHLSVRLLGQTQHLHTGHIFLFNHFTRFETLIPPQLIFKETGAICRSVAHHALFRVSPYLARALTEGGAVPSNTPHLLPFLAAEILRGHKVIIFPEGGLIKDKGARKLHKGAAVLAVYLDLLKLHLRTLFAKNDTAAIAHWVAQLGVESAEILQTRIADPTLVVPSTITFFPIRSEVNNLTRLISATMGPLPDLLTDELSTETNLLLRPTDMDVVVRPPLTTGIGERPSHRLIFKGALSTIGTVEELFALTEEGDTLLRPLVRQTLNSAISRLRDDTAAVLYTGLTVNLHHVLSQVVHTFQSHGVSRIPAAQFHQAVYWTLTRLREQAALNPALILHSGVANPHTAQNALGGHGHRFTRFMAMLRHNHLVKLKHHTYHLSQRLNDAVTDDDVRLEHPIHLHVNEAAAQPAVRLAALWAFRQSSPTPTRELALALLQDLHGTVLSTPEIPTPRAALLLHGLSADTPQLEALSQHLTQQGITTLRLRLPGHGQTPQKLFGVTAQHWISHAHHGLAILQGLGFTHISVIGFSTGALLALRLAQLHQGHIAAVVAAAPPVQLASPLRHLLTPALLVNGLIGSLPGLGRLLPHGPLPWYDMETEEPAFSYTHVPLSSVQQVVRLAALVKDHLTASTAPTLILQGTADATSSPAATLALAQKLPQAQVHTLKDAGHLILSQNTLHSFEVLSTFLQSQPEPQPTPKAPTHGHDSPHSHPLP